MSFAQKSVLLALPLFFGNAVLAEELKLPSKCVNWANSQVTDPAFGFDPDGNSFFFDASGRTNILNQDKIVRRVLEGNTEEIVYKTKTAKYEPGSPKPEFEVVERSIQVTRDASGRLVNVTKAYDVAPQFKFQKEALQSGYRAGSVIKSMRYEFSGEGNDCALNQIVASELENEKSAPEQKILFDKKFCDQLAPIIRQIGMQNAQQCATLLNTAHLAMDMRNRELAKEGKSLKVQDQFGRSTKFAKSATTVFNLGAAIQSCQSGEGTGLGYGGYGMSPYGYGMPIGGASPHTAPAPASSESSRQSP